MKKFCFLLAILAIVTISVFTSCKKYYSTQLTQQLQALTDTFSISSNQWDTASNGSYYYTDSLNNLRFVDSIGALTYNTNINDSGAVFIYASVDSGNSYEMLPVISDSGYIFQGSSTVGAVTIKALPYPTTTVPDFPVYIKVVSIPSTIQYQYSNVNMQNYNEVKAAFHF